MAAEFEAGQGMPAGSAQGVRLLESELMDILHSSWSCLQ